MINNKQLKVLEDMQNLIKQVDAGEGADLTPHKPNSEEAVRIPHQLNVELSQIIDTLYKERKQNSNKSNEYNKRHAERHKILNNIASNKRRGNMEKMEYWRNKLKELNAQKPKKK